MTASAHIYPTLVRKALDLTGEELRGRGVIGEIMIHGQSVILVRYSWSDDGIRIRLIFPSRESRDRPPGSGGSRPKHRTSQ